MRISFSMDGIRSMDLLYTYTKELHPELGEGLVEHYHGEDYCKLVIDDVLNAMVSDWTGQTYLGTRGRIANEIFALSSTAGLEYTISFAVSTYNGDAARLEITITAPDTEDYDHRLEKLKIALKNRLLPDWCRCTWFVDEQAAALCKNAYERTFVIENNLRAFASKVLIHFLGVDWIHKAGLEKEAESVNNLKEKFIQRVSAFDNINTDFLSMTLETLVGVMFNGVTYRDEVILSRKSYATVQAMGAKQKTSGGNVAAYIKNLRTVDKQIWEDLFAPYIEDPTAFKTTIHSFIEDRNHVAHSKVLSWSAYRVILQDFQKMDALILSADAKFERDETSDELFQTWQAEQETIECRIEYDRKRLSGETGMDILDEHEIQSWFEDVLHKLFNLIYQQYHLDVCYDISNLAMPDEEGVAFTISCPAVEDGSARIDIAVEYFIDDDLSGESVCRIAARNGAGIEISKAEIRFHNGNGYENEDGIMEATDCSEYDTSELGGFQEDLLSAIESLNPYPERLDALSYESKGAIQFVADFPCEQCGKLGVSIDETFLTIGRCCYCGYENELAVCGRCGELISADLLENGFCPSCAAYIDKQ